jgi:predicted transcriptional regulator
MTSEVTTVSEDALLEDVVKIMEHRRIKRVPVTRAINLLASSACKSRSGTGPIGAGSTANAPR